MEFMQGVRDSMAQLDPQRKEIVEKKVFVMGSGNETKEIEKIVKGENVFIMGSGMEVVEK